MANMVATQVTVLTSWTEGGVTGKRRIVKIVDLALTGQGGKTNQILAASLGFTYLEESSNGVLHDPSRAIIPTVPDYDGSRLFLMDPNATAITGTAGTADGPGDWTGTVTVTVKGY